MMTVKNYEKVIEVLAEKVAGLELDLSFTKFERDQFKNENNILKEENKALKELLKPCTCEKECAK